MTEVINPKRKLRSKDNQAWRQVVQEDVECESFGYAFFSYSDYAWVNDPKFQELREAFIKSANELADYVGVSRP